MIAVYHFIFTDGTCSSTYVRHLQKGKMKMYLKKYIKVISIRLLNYVDRRQMGIEVNYS